MALTIGCEGAPARSKPWRTAPGSEGSAGEGESAAGKVAETIEHERTAAAERRARTLRVRLEAEPAHLNPLVDPDVEALRVAEGTLFETLVRHEPTPGGGPGRYAPGLAESWRISPDGTELRFRLRDGVTFHDGKGFSAVDAQFSIDTARSRALKTHRLGALLADVITVEMWGPRDLRLTLRKPNAYVLRAVAEIPMLPAHVYGTGGINRHPRNRSPIGTGPYRLARWEAGAHIRLARNPSWWGPAPAIEEIDFIIEPDGAHALLMAREDQLDVLPSMVPEHYPEQATVPGIVETFVPLRLAPAGLDFLALNTRRPPFDDVRVRRAAAMLIDRQRLVDEIHDGLARAVAGPVWPGGPGDGPTPQPPAFDPTAAAALLDEAGWRDLDGDGVRERDGGRLRVAVLVLNESRGDAERTLVTTGLRKAGFVVEQRPGEPAVILNRLRGGDFDAAFIRWRGRVDDNLAPLVGQGGAFNWGGFTSPEVEALLARMRQAWEPAARAPRAGELAEVLAREAPFVPLTAPAPFGLVHRRVRGLVVHDGWFAIDRLSLEPTP